MNRFFFSILTLGILFVSFTSQIQAQKPEKVYSIVKQIKSFDWYATQAELWGKILETDKTNAEAWLNYYTANRMAWLMFRDQFEQKKGKYLRDLTGIVQDISVSIPDSYEYYHIKVWNNHSFDEQQKKDMFKAYEIAPDRVESYSNLVSYYEIEMDPENSAKMCKKWFESGDLSAGILNWNYNVLASLEPNSILITSGDNDTFPAWVLQYVKNFRRDVTVLNISLLQIDRYREKMFKKLQIKPFEPGSTQFDMFGVMKDIIKHIASQSGQRSVYLAVTLNQQLYSDLESKTYLIGLALKYSDKDFDNMAYLLRNYEQNWLLDYLTVDFSNDPSSSVVDLMNTNYIPILAKIYEHYRLCGKMDEAAKAKRIAQRLASRTDNAKSYEELFEK